MLLIFNSPVKWNAGQFMLLMRIRYVVRMIYFHKHNVYVVASALKDPICHSNECQIGSFSSEAKK